MNYKKSLFWISSYPKSGNTWVRLILCGLYFTENGNIESFNILKKIPKFDTLSNFKFIKQISENDYRKIFNDDEYNEESFLTYSKYWIEAQKRLRIIDGDFSFFKTHNARVKINNSYYTNSLTTKGFIYISRDPRDIVLSYSKYMNKDIDFTINFLINGQLMGKEKKDGFMPEFLLSWKDHYKSWKNFSDVPNLFLKYEDLLNDTEKELKKIIIFFKKNFNIEISNEKKKIKNIIESTNFNKLKKIEKKYGFFEKSNLSEFFRKGEKNQWQKKLSKGQINAINNSFENTLFKLKYY